MHESISLTHHGSISTVTYTNPPFNLLDIEIMDSLIEAHREADTHSGTRVIVTRSGLEGMFCNGLNPLTVLENDHNGRVAIFEAVGRLLNGVYSLRKPHISVLNGPAMAGGAVLAILSDFRYMDAARGAICFAEAKVGVPVPDGLVAAIASVCHPKYVREIVMLGKNFKAEEALEAGLVDGIAPPEELDAMVAKQAARLARLSLEVVSECKASIRASILPRIEATLRDENSMSRFAQFLGPDYLEEGLKAFLESRQPVFVR